MGKGERRTEVSVYDCGSDDCLDVINGRAQVDVITGGGGGVQYDEDTPHVSGDKVTMAGVVQQTVDAALSTNGDRSVLQVDASGFLKVNVKTGGTGGTQFAEDSPHTTGDTGTLALAVRNDAGTVLADTTLDYIPLTTDSTGALRVTGGGGGTQYAEDTLHVSGDTLTFAGVVQQTADAALSGDGDRSLLQVDATGWAKVNVKTSALPTGAATFAEQQTQTASLSVMGGWDNAGSDGASVSGDVAHDTADAGEPVKVGMKAIGHGANPTGVTANDRTNWYANRAGVPWVIGGHPNVITREVTVLDADGAQTDASLLGTIAAGTAVVITMIDVMASGANTVDVKVRIGFGTATVPAAALAGVNGMVLSHSKIKPGSGVVKGNGSGTVGMGASDEELRITSDDPVGGAITVTITYYTIEI